MAGREVWVIPSCRSPASEEGVGSRASVGQALGRGCTLTRGARQLGHLQVCVGGQQSWGMGVARPRVPTPPWETAPASLPSAWNVHCACSLATRLGHPPLPPPHPPPPARCPHSCAASCVSSSSEPSRPRCPAPGRQRLWAQAAGARLPVTCWLPALLLPLKPQPHVHTSPPSLLQSHLGPLSRKCDDSRESSEWLLGLAREWDGQGAWGPTGLLGQDSYVDATHCMPITLQ